MRAGHCHVRQSFILAFDISQFAFGLSDTAGVVCERNSILNLAVIHQRHKVVHWLIEEKKADIETSDRGHFTPVSRPELHLALHLSCEMHGGFKIGFAH